MRPGSAEMTLVTSASKSTSPSRICGAWRFKCAPTCGYVFFLAMRTSQTEVVAVLGLSAAEAAPSVAISASCYDQIEYVRIFSIVKPELKFVQVERQIGLADFVIAAHDAALEERPERFNRIGVSGADYVFALAIAHHAVIVVATKQAIATVFIGREQPDSSSYPQPPARNYRESRYRCFRSSCRPRCPC